MTRNRDADPAGYTHWGNGRGNSLLLPDRTVRAMLEERKAAELVDPARKEEEKKESLPVAQSARPAWVDVWGCGPVPGYHRVLHQHPELANGSLFERRMSRSADKDSVIRTKGIFDKLAASGPDRILAKASNWRDALKELAIEMPHFRQPLRLLSQGLALGEVASSPTRIPPMLLLGPPGVGKTHFSQKVAEIFGAPHASLAFDQPGSASQLRGSDKYWGNSHYGLLFELLCLGDFANPVILLDEIDKASDGRSGELKALSQLHGALEPVTARKINDISVDIEFDASLVTYIATANSLHGIEPSVLSRFEIFTIEPPEPREAVETARRVTQSVLNRLGLEQRVRFDPKGYYVLAHLSPRLMQRTVEKSVAAAVAEKRMDVGEADVWAELGLDGETELH